MMNMQLLLFDVDGMRTLIGAIATTCVNVNPKTRQYDNIDFCLMMGIKEWCKGFHDLRRTPNIAPVKKAPYDLVRVSNLMRERQAYKRYLTEIEQRIRKCLKGEDDYVELIREILFGMMITPFVKVEPWIKECAYVPTDCYRFLKRVHKDDVFEPLIPLRDYRNVAL